MEQKNQTTDLLTGTLTRQAFEERLAVLLAQARTNLSPLSLAFLDIDHFLLVNQQYGHVGGDTVLTGVGDEFALIFPNTEREQAFLRLEHARTEVEALNEYRNGDQVVSANITVCVGVAACPIDASEENELLRKADAALYRAKSTGRNKIVLAYEERMVPKTAHFTQTQLERLSMLAKEQGVGEAVLLREALDDLLTKYEHGFISQEKNNGAV